MTTTRRATVPQLLAASTPNPHSPPPTQARTPHSPPSAQAPPPSHPPPARKPQSPNLKLSLPTPKPPAPSHSTLQDDVYVGRVRRDISRGDNKGLDLFVCGDQIKKGAALNAVQIAELLL